METIILDSIPFNPDPQEFTARLRLDRSVQDAQAFATLLESACALARPKAIFCPAYVDQRAPEATWLSGVQFTSRVMAVNLEKLERAFPFVATAGVELESWAAGIDDMWRAYQASAILDAALQAAIGAVAGTIEQRFGTGHTAMMNPGSLEDWPLSQQTGVFSLLGGPEAVEAATGVHLQKNYLMKPIKTVSGLRFQAEADYFNCQLCQRQDCPNRQAPYDSHLWEQKYARG